MKDSRIGQVLDGIYRIDERVGEGGMGIVYKAYHLKWGRHVAIKVMHPELASEPEFRKRFVDREFIALLDLNHPNIVRVHNFHESGPDLFIVMQFIEGDNLRAFLKGLEAQGRRIELNSALELVCQVCEAIEYAHGQNWVHRDIKPENIMLEPTADPSGKLSYRPILTDLGLAKMLEDKSKPDTGSHTLPMPSTLTKTLIATPAYMSPEQALGQPIDQRTDVFLLGILLYELMVGQRLFQFKDLVEATTYFGKTPPERPPRPRSIRPDLHPKVEGIILQALQRYPSDRFQSAGEMAEALADALKSISEPEPEPSPPDHIIVVERSDGTEERVYLKPEQVLTIGRGDYNDLVLDDLHVSKRHAQVEFDGHEYRILDHDSTNGTYLYGAPLLGGVPHVWKPGTELRIGENRLYLVRDDQLDVPGEFELKDPPGTRYSPGRWVGVHLKESTLSVDPGSRATAVVTIINRGSEPDSFMIAVEGAPAEWVMLEPLGDIRLMPDTCQTVALTIRPPRVPESRPGDYPLSIRVASRDEPAEVAEWPAKLTVNPYSEFDSQLKPQKITLPPQLMEQQKGTFKVAVENRGNTPRSFNIACEDEADELVFEPAESELTLSEGEGAESEFSVAPRARRWIGGEKSHPLSARVSTPKAKTQTHSGELISTGIPIWLLLLVGGLGLLLLAGGICLIDPNCPDGTPVPFPTPTPSHTPSPTATSKAPVVVPTTSEPTDTHTPTSTQTPTSTEPPTPSPTPTATTPPPPLSYVFDYVLNQDGINAQGTPLPPGDECWDRTTGKPVFVGQVKNARGDVIWGARVYYRINGWEPDREERIKAGGFYEFVVGSEWEGGYIWFLRLEIDKGEAVLSQDAQGLKVKIENCKKRVDFVQQP